MVEYGKELKDSNTSNISQLAITMAIKKILIHMAAGLSIGMMCYAIYLGAMATTWPVPDASYLQLTETAAERKVVVLDAFRGYHTTVFLGLCGLAFPFCFTVGGYFIARRSPVAFLKRPSLQITIYIGGVLAVFIAQGCFAAIVPQYQDLSEFLYYCVHKR